MNVVFRVDASGNIGTGHVMRCLALAKALRQYGTNCKFVCRLHPGNLVDRIRLEGFEVLCLPPQEASGYFAPQENSDRSYSVWLGADWNVDAQQTLAQLNEKVDCLIVDHYALDSRWEKMLKAAVKRVAVIDDLADRQHECDILLDQNPGRSQSDYSKLVPPYCNVIADTHFALLRPEFAEIRAQSLKRRTNPVLKHLLISMGGVDKDNVTGQILDVLSGCALPPDCRISVVLGCNAPWKDQIRSRVSAMPWPSKLLVDVQDMAGLMSDCDLAIGAAGVSALERCCLGLPSLIMVLADNQRNGAEALQQAGAAVLLDKDRLSSDLKKNVELIMNTDMLARLADASCRLTDGVGASRVAKEIIDA